MGNDASVAAAGPRPVIVVVGAGLIGTKLIAELRKAVPASRAPVVVIDPKQYADNNIAGPRAIVDSAFAQNVTFPHAQWLPAAAAGDADDTEFVVGKAVGLNVAERTVAVDRLAASLDPAAAVPGAAPVRVNVKYDFLVIASGSRYDVLKGTQITLAERLAYLKVADDTIRAARHVVVIGGGSVGVDIAGEIRSQYAADVLAKRKRVTIVQRGAALVPNFPAHGQVKITELLRAAGVTVLTGQTLPPGTYLPPFASKPAPAPAPAAVAVDEKGVPLAVPVGAAPPQSAAGAAQAAVYSPSPDRPVTMTTSAGVVLDGVDLVLTATGSAVNTEWLQGSGVALGAVNQRVRVSATMQATGVAGAAGEFDRIVVVGDAAGVDEEALAFNGQKHVPIAVANLKAFVDAHHSGIKADAVALKAHGGGGLKRPMGIGVFRDTTVLACPCCCECLCTGSIFSNFKLQMVQKPPETVPHTKPAAAGASR